MSSPNTTTCPANATPEPINLGIDSKSVFAVAPRGNYTSDQPDDWMVTCCAPNAVQLANDGGLTGTCWEWCDLPEQFTNATSDKGRLGTDFLGCLTFTAKETNSSYPPQAVLVSAAAGAGGGLGGLGLVLVLAVSFLFR